MIIIDGNRFVTTEGAQSFYLERRTTHIGDWDIWLIKQDEYSIWYYVKKKYQSN